MAIKYLQRGRAIDKHVSRELKSHISFCHPHVIRFRWPARIGSCCCLSMWMPTQIFKCCRHLFLTESHLAIVFEYAEGGDLYNYVA